MEVVGESVMVVARCGLPAEPSAVIGDHAVASGQQHRHLPCQGHCPADIRGSGRSGTRAVILIVDVDLREFSVPAVTYGIANPRSFPSSWFALSGCLYAFD